VNLSDRLYLQLSDLGADSPGWLQGLVVHGADAALRLLAVLPAAAVIAWLWRAVLPYVVALAVLVGFARLYEGVHYPHDVLVGLVGGAVVALLLLHGATRLLSPTPRVIHEGAR
jgi:hypothetical protein